jgi:hypothetical protein
MAGLDLSGVSDEELLNATQSPQAAKPSGPSDEELLTAAGQPPARPNTAEDMAKSFGSGIVRGATSLVDMPSDIVQGGLGMVERATGYDIPEWAERGAVALLPGGMNRALTGESSKEQITRELPSVMGYKPKTTAGRYSSTVGEFLPGAVAGPGGVARNIIAGGILPALGSEFLGQTFEGSSNKYVEPAARLVGAILGGFGANGLESLTRKVISPGGGATAERLAAADTLNRAGVPVTAGQKTGSPSILAAEGDTAAGQAFAGAAPDSPQAQAFTAATMQKLGSNSPVASEEAMDAAQKAIVDRMQNAVAGVDVMPTYPLMSSLSDAKKGYFANTNATVRPPIIEDIIAEVQHAARTGQPIPATTMAAWRSNLGKHLYSNDKFVADAAYDVRSALDDAIENSMTAAGQPERMAAWREARDQYRNYLAAESALKPNKDRGILGIITPQDLINAVLKQDRRGVVTGRRGEIGDLAKSGVLVAKPLPAARGNQALRKFAPLAEAVSGIGGGLGALQLASFLGMGPVGTALTTGAAVGVPIADAARRAIMRQAMRPMVQKYLGNQLVNPEIPSNAVAPAVRGAATSIAMQEPQPAPFKRGGRVSSHEHDADQLVRAAERAKKGWSAETEPLLNQSDDAVAHALEVANRSI